MALFHCMVRHGTVRYGSLLGGFPLGTVPSTWYFFSTTSVEVPIEPYRYQNVTCINSADHWMAGENRHYLLRHLNLRHETLLYSFYPARFKSAQPAKDRTQLLFKTNAHFCINHKIAVSLSVEESTDVPLVDSRGADPARAWWHDARRKKALCIYVYFWTCYIYRVCFLFIFVPLYLCFASIKNNLIE